MNSIDSRDSKYATLASMHSDVNNSHEHTRAELLSLLDKPRPNPGQPSAVVSVRQLACGGVIAATISAIAIGFWFVIQSSPAKAMERMAKALDQVNAYSFRMEKTYISRKGEGRTVQQITTGVWRTTPAALRAHMLIHETLATNTVVPERTNNIVNLEEAHEAGQGGILIDHLKREYWRVTDQLTAHSIPPGSPQVAIFMVQQRRGRAVRDLGQKYIAGHIANGLEFVLDSSQPVSELGETVSDDLNSQPDSDWRNMTFEVWIDPNTNLPIELRSERHGEDFDTTYVFTALGWNVMLDEAAFELQVPGGYTQRQIR
jgi:outer membrane lipoprotein-sorting protein